MPVRCVFLGIYKVAALRNTLIELGLPSVSQQCNQPQYTIQKSVLASKFRTARVQCSIEETPRAT